MKCRQRLGPRRSSSAQTGGKEESDGHPSPRLRTTAVATRRSRFCTGSRATSCGHPEGNYLGVLG